MGKTHNTRLVLQKNEVAVYIKPRGMWWNRYDQQDIVFMEEFHGHMPFNDFLRLSDEGEFLCEVKGGYVQFNSKGIIITSNRAPNEQYLSVFNDHARSYEAYLKRIPNAHDCTDLTYTQIQALVQDFIDEIKGQDYF